MARKKRESVRESRERILLERFSDIDIGDTFSRRIARFRNTIRSKQSKRQDNCRKHSKTSGDVDVPASWFLDPGSSDAKGIDVPGHRVRRHLRTNPKTGKKDIVVKAHYRLNKNFPGYCKTRSTRKR